MPKAKYPKNAQGLYYAYVQDGGIRADGYPSQRRICAKTQAKLDEKLEKYREERKYNIEQEDLTVDQWFEKWMRNYKSSCTENTKAFYRNLYRKHISPAIGSMKIDAVREIHAQPILSALYGDHSERTVKSVRAILFSLFDKARINKLIRSNPCENLTAKGKASKEKRALTITERNRFLTACSSGLPGSTYAAFLYFFGLRRGEALALKGSDINLVNGTITISRAVAYPDNNLPVIKETKTRAGIRTLPIPAKAYDYIPFSDLPNGFLFTKPDGADGELLTYTLSRTMWSRFIKFAFPEGTDITRHYLRHNYCTMLFEAGVDLLTVKELAGHADIQTTMSIYTHYTETLQKQSTTKVLSIG